MWKRLSSSHSKAKGAVLAAEIDEQRVEAARSVVLPVADGGEHDAAAAAAAPRLRRTGSGGLEEADEAEDARMALAEKRRLAAERRGRQALLRAQALRDGKHQLQAEDFVGAVAAFGRGLKCAPHDYELLEWLAMAQTQQRSQGSPGDQARLRALRAQAEREAEREADVAELGASWERQKAAAYPSTAAFSGVGGAVGGGGHGEGGVSPERELRSSGLTPQSPEELAAEQALLRAQAALAEAEAAKAEGGGLFGLHKHKGEKAAAVEAARSAVAEAAAEATLPAVGAARAGGSGGSGSGRPVSSKGRARQRSAKAVKPSGPRPRTSNRVSPRVSVHTTGAGQGGVRGSAEGASALYATPTRQRPSTAGGTGSGAEHRPLLRTPSAGSRRGGGGGEDLGVSMGRMSPRQQRRWAMEQAFSGMVDAEAGGDSAGSATWKVKVHKLEEMAAEVHIRIPAVISLCK